MEEYQQMFTHRLLDISSSLWSTQHTSWSCNTSCLDTPFGQLARQFKCLSLGFPGSLEILAHAAILVHRSSNTVRDIQSYLRTISPDNVIHTTVSYNTIRHHASRKYEYESSLLISNYNSTQFDYCWRRYSIAWKINSNVSQCFSN